MSWLKIEFQRDKAIEKSKTHMEQIDYEKIREITREVLKEEMKKQQNNQPTTLTKADIQDAVLNGIVQASNQMDSSKVEVEKPGFWKSVLEIIRGKRQGDGNYTARFMATILSTGLNFLALMGAITCVVSIVVIIQTAVKMNWNEAKIYTNIAAILCVLVCLIIVALYSLIFRGAANDIRFEKDRNYIVAVFSGIVSFVALIISIIALYRGGCGC